MVDSFWQRQEPSKPLFEELIWSRPENKTRAGKLLIIGGNTHGFSKLAESYNHSIKAGAGYIKVALPNSLKNIVGKYIEDADFLPSTQTGSFARESAELIDLAKWADLSLVAGDLSHNSETSIVMESFIKDQTKLLVINDNSIDLFLTSPKLILSRQKTCLVISLNKLQKLLTKDKSTKAITSSMALLQLVESLGELTTEYPINICTFHQNQLIASSAGFVSSTPLDKEVNYPSLSSFISVWWLQNATKTFEALTTGVYEYINS